MARRSVKKDGVDAWMTGLILVWGTAFVAIRALGESLSPLEITWFRYLPFLFLFGIWLLITQRRKLSRLSGRDWGLYIILGLLGVFGYHIPLYYGMQDGGWLPGPGASAGTAAVLIATTPLWTLLFSVLSGRERFDSARLLGSIVAFSGVLIVLLIGTGKVDFGFARKVGLVLLAPIFWSWYSVLGKPLVNRDGGLFMTGLTMCIGTSLMVPFGIKTGLGPILSLSSLDIFWMIYLSILATVAGYAVWNYALEHRSPSQLTAWIYFVPVVATLTGWLLLDEGVTLWFLLGAALVIAGVWWVNRVRSIPQQP